MSRIAIIEDDEAVRMLYRIKLVQEGFEVVEARDGLEALSIIETSKPDVVLLDLMLPRMSGDEVLKIMRSSPWGENIKVVIITNLAEDEAPDNLRQLGISRFVVKALHTPSQLVEVVRQVLAT